VDNRHSFERLRLGAPVQKIGIGHAAVRVFVTDVTETIVSGDQRESFEQHGIGDREYCGVDADANRQHDYCDGGESGVLEQGSKA